MRMNFSIWCVVCSASLLDLAGCSPPTNPKVLRQEILAADPAFKSSLMKRDEVAERISVFKRELELKRQESEEHIAKIRQDLKAATDRVNQKIGKEKSLLDPELKNLELASGMASEELRAKRQQRASLGRSISQLRKALKQSGPQWSAKERARRDRELSELMEEAMRIDQELAALGAHIRLLKMKRMVLRV